MEDGREAPVYQHPWNQNVNRYQSGHKIQSKAATPMTASRVYASTTESLDAAASRNASNGIGGGPRLSKRNTKQPEDRGERESHLQTQAARKHSL